MRTGDVGLLAMRRKAVWAVALGALAAALMVAAGPAAGQAAPADRPGASPPAPAADEKSPAPAQPAGGLGKADKLPPGLGVKDQDVRGLLWQSLAAVLVILALGGVAIFVLRRLGPRIAAVRGKRMLLRETFHLGPQKALHLMQVGSRTLLVGASRERLTMLADVTDDVPPPEDDEAAKPKQKFVIPSSDDDVGDAARPRRRRPASPLDPGAPRI